MDICEIRKRLEAISFKDVSLNEDHSKHPYVSVQQWKEYKDNTDKLTLLDELGEKNYEEMKKKYSLKVNLKVGSFPLFDEVRIVVIGKTGVGKSSTANTILGKDWFKEAATAASVTGRSRMRKNKVNGCLIKVIDTPGFHDPQRSKEELTREIARVMKIFANGIHAFIYVQDISNPRFTQEDKETLESIEDMFGGGIKNFPLLVYSKADTLSTSSLGNFRDEQRSDKSQAIAHFLKDLDWKVVAVNNKTTIPAEKKRNQEVIIAMMGKLRQQNDNAVYSNEMFEEAARKRKELEEKGKKMGWNPAVMTVVDEVIAADPDVVKDTKEVTESIKKYLEGKIEDTERELREARQRKEKEDELRKALKEEIEQQLKQKGTPGQKQEEEHDQSYREEQIMMEQGRAGGEQEWTQRQKQQEMKRQQAFGSKREELLGEEIERACLENENLIVENNTQLQIAREALKYANTAKEINEIVREHESVFNSMVGVVKRGCTKVKNLFTKP